MSDQSWKDFLDQVEKNGFQIIERRRFAYDGVMPEIVIAAHPEKFLLLSATSFIWSHKPDGEDLNGGNVYGCINPKIPDSGKLWNALIGFSHSPFNRLPITFDYDVRHGAGHFKLLEDSCEFVRWPGDDPFVWLLDCVQEKVRKGDDWRKYRDEFLGRSPDWVRDFVLPK